MARGPVLVVEDDADIRALVADVLRGEGYAVVVVADGYGAVRALERERPALLLLDLRLPGLDGREVTAAMRARGIRTPILVMTAERDGAAWAAAIQADGYVAKPFDLDALVAAVARLAGAATAEGEVRASP